jgi:hypothetical protein
MPNSQQALISALLLVVVLCRSGAGADAGAGEFTADDVAALGHSNSKSKAIVSCLHKLGRASLQRSATGANVYKLVGSY